MKILMPFLEISANGINAIMNLLFLVYHVYKLAIVKFWKNLFQDVSRLIVWYRMSLCFTIFLISRVGYYLILRNFTTTLILIFLGMFCYFGDFIGFKHCRFTRCENAVDVQMHYKMWAKDPWEPALQGIVLLKVSLFTCFILHNIVNTLEFT